MPLAPLPPGAPTLAASKPNRSRTFSYLMCCTMHTHGRTAPKWYMCSLQRCGWGRSVSTAGVEAGCLPVPAALLAHRVHEAS